MTSTRVQQARPAPATRLAGRRTSGAGDTAGLDPAHTAALGEAAQRANAGPHAASLAGLQSVVAQRACADCEHVRRAMGGADPPRHSAGAGARAPVQRLILGDQGQYDTQNDADIGGVVAELRSMDYDSLVFVRSMLDPNDARESGYVKLIDYELETADALGGIDHLNRTQGGLFTTASIFVDGEQIARTEAQTHPINGQDYYQHVLPATATQAEATEEHISHNDSEVGTLEDAYYELDTYLTANGIANPVQVRILVAGTAGPCDGCKRRLETFRAEVQQRLPAGSLLSIESAYLNATSVVNRSGSATRYGYAGEIAGRTAGGLAYWRHRYPLVQS